MKKTDFSLRNKITAPIMDIPLPEELHLPVPGFILQTGRNKRVKQGTCVGEHPAFIAGDIHSPWAGKVKKVDAAGITIVTDKENTAEERVDLNAMAPGKALKKALCAMGINTQNLVEADTLIINGINPEPGVSVYQQLLLDENLTIEKGLAFAQKIINPKKTWLAIPKRCRATLLDSSIHFIKGTYPASLDDLVAKAVTSREKPDKTMVISALELYFLGRVLETCQPVMETILTIGGQNFRVAVGTPVGKVLEFAGKKVNAGDKIILGGPMRGEAVYSLEHGIGKNVYGLSVIPKGSYPPVTDFFCINCGECVLNCPARIMPNMISRYAQYNLFDKAREYGLYSCFECGMCVFNCPAGRPLRQYIRFAKDQLLISAGK